MSDTRAPGRRHLALAGLVAGLAGLAVSHAATMLLSIRATPLTAVAESIIAITPGAIAEALIRLVGQYDKPLLVAGTTVGLVALAALAGAVSRRSLIPGVLVFLALGAVGFAAVRTRPDASTYDVLPVLLGVVTWVVTLVFLRNPLVSAESESEPAVETLDTPVEESRRGFLLRAGGLAVAALVVGVAGDLSGRTRRLVEESRRLLRLPVTGGAVPDGADLGVAGVEPWRTANQVFYRIDTALVVPTPDPNDWVLRVHGMVDRELEISFRDLLAREMTEAWVTLCCVSNEVGGDLIGNAWWSGVRVADVLADAGIRPDADAVLQTSEDGWTCGTPLSALTDGRNALLAVAMNGQPLPVEHGFPVRMVVPGLYGYVSATKWLVDIEVSRFDRISAYWTDREWAERGPVKTQSRIDTPRDGDEVAVGSRRIGGSAWAQHTGIARVEYQLDGGAWQQAELGRVPGDDTWVQWAGPVELSDAEHVLAVRATDRSGYTQTPVRQGVLPDGATGWHTVTFRAG